MNQLQTIQTLRDMHTDDTSTPMVYEVWFDGEITLTKGADLYGQRTLHTVDHPLSGRWLPSDCLFPRYKASRIIVADYATAQRARDLIKQQEG